MRRSGSAAHPDELGLPTVVEEMLVDVVAEGFLVIRVPPYLLRVLDAVPGGD